MLKHDLIPKLLFCVTNYRPFYYADGIACPDDSRVQSTCFDSVRTSASMLFPSGVNVPALDGTYPWNFTYYGSEQYDSAAYIFAVR